MRPRIKENYFPKKMGKLSCSFSAACPVSLNPPPTSHRFDDGGHVVALTRAGPGGRLEVSFDLLPLKCAGLERAEGGRNIEQARHWVMEVVADEERPGEGQDRAEFFIQARKKNNGRILRF